MLSVSFSLGNPFFPLHANSHHIVRLLSLGRMYRHESDIKFRKPRARASLFIGQIPSVYQEIVTGEH